MKLKKFLVLGLLAICLVVSIVACQGNGDRVVIGSKNFTEQIILGEILAQQIERKTNIKVDRKFPSRDPPPRFQSSPNRVS